MIIQTAISEHRKCERYPPHPSDEERPYFSGGVHFVDGYGIDSSNATMNLSASGS
jgi:hypothetical protein